MSIIGACVVYNNQHIFHKPLQTFNALCDKLFIVDDGSTECSLKERSKMIQDIFSKPSIIDRIPKSIYEIHYFFLAKEP